MDRMEILKLAMASCKDWTMAQATLMLQKFSGEQLRLFEAPDPKASFPFNRTS